MPQRGDAMRALLPRYCADRYYCATPLRHATRLRWRAIITRAIILLRACRRYASEDGFASAAAAIAGCRRQKAVIEMRHYACRHIFRHQRRHAERHTLNATLMQRDRDIPLASTIPPSIHITGRHACAMSDDDWPPPSRCDEAHIP